MLTKCIGIVSYFPEKEPLRTNRKKAFNNLIKQLDEYFKLPIIIVAQCWSPEDFNIEYSKQIKVYSYNKPLGVTGANIILREKLLLEEYDYFIHLDDDIHFVGTQEGVNIYLSEIDAHPNMFGQFSKYQLCAISKDMLKIMNWDFIKNMESWRGEIWEDIAYMGTYKKVYADRFFNFSCKGLKMDFGPSEKDPNTTWYNKYINQNYIRTNTMSIMNRWISTFKK